MGLLGRSCGNIWRIFFMLWSSVGSPKSHCFVSFAAFLTLDLTLNLDVFGLLAHRDITAYTVIGGWSITPEQVYIGIVRVLYPFFGGLLLFRIGKLIRVKAGFWWCSLLVVAA